MCSGNEKKTMPLTPSSGASDAAVEVIRPPKEWPPARVGSPFAAFRAAATADRIVAVQVSWEFLAVPCSEYGKL